MVPHPKGGILLCGRRQIEAFHPFGLKGATTIVAENQCRCSVNDDSHPSGGAPCTMAIGHRTRGLCDRFFGLSGRDTADVRDDFLGRRTWAEKFADTDLLELDRFLIRDDSAAE